MRNYKNQKIKNFWVNIVKKNPKEFKALEKEYYELVEQKGLSYKLCSYVWDVLVSCNKGYGFNLSHTLAYSILGIQEANLALYYPRVFWNTANLISDSGGEDGNTNYGKMSTAIANIQKEGIQVMLPDINRVKFGFHPDKNKNEIVFGLKGIQNVSDSVSKVILKNRPYTSFEDFYNKMMIEKESNSEFKMGTKAFIYLIKSGAFDALENKPREEIMQDFLKKISQPLQSLSWKDLPMLKEMNLLTDSQIAMEYRLYKFKKYLFDKKFISYKDGKSPSTFYYYLEEKFALPFFLKYFEPELKERDLDYVYDSQGRMCVKRGKLEKAFDKLTQNFKAEVLDNNSLLDKVNEIRYNNLWEEKISGSLSKWEMESLGYYYSGHELNGLNKELYNIQVFDNLPETPKVESWYYYKDTKKPRFSLCRIAGTVIDRDKTHHTVTLLTLEGVVLVKFYKGQFSFYDRQLSEVDEDSGKKSVLERSWFSRGTKLLITGYRRDDQFIPKQYNDSIYKHSVQFILDMKDNGELILQDERIGTNEENEQ